MSSNAQLPDSLLEVNEGPRLLKILTPMAVVVTATVSLRIAARLHLRTGLGLDDWLILVSLVLSWGTYVIAVSFVNFGGLGRPVAVNIAINPNRLVNDKKTLFAGQIIYALLIMTTKLSILAMYWRIFPTRLMKLGCTILAGLSAAWCLAVVLVTIFQCDPVKKALDPFMSTGHCISSTKFFLGIIIPNILTDVLILCLPTYEVSKLHLPRCQRIALASVFLLGAGVVAASAVRLYYHLKLAEVGINGDMTMVMFNPALWTVLEPDMAVICACLPMMRSLVVILTSSSLYRLISSKLTNIRSSNKEQATLDTIQTIGGTPVHKRAGEVKNSRSRKPPQLSTFELLVADEEDAAAG